MTAQPLDTFGYVLLIANMISASLSVRWRNWSIATLNVLAIVIILWGHRP